MPKKKLKTIFEGELKFVAANNKTELQLIGKDGSNYTLVIGKVALAGLVYGDWDRLKITVEVDTKGKIHIEFDGHMEMRYLYTPENK